MRTTFAAEPRSFDWHSGFHTKTYIAQPLPPIGWKRVCVSDAIKWCDGILLTWASKNDSGEKPTNESNVAGFLFWPIRAIGLRTNYARFSTRQFRERRDQLMTDGTPLVGD
jgi:hypothetical protein